MASIKMSLEEMKAKVNKAFNNLSEIDKEKMREEYLKTVSVMNKAILDINNIMKND